MNARARVVVRGDRIVELRSEPPLALRQTPDGIYMVGMAAGPIGGDEVLLEIEVGAGSALTIRSAAAAIALPGPAGAPSRLTIRAEVSGELRWLPEPSIATRDCDHTVDVRLRIARGGTVQWRDELILGRVGERAGSWTSRMIADHDGAPLLRQTLSIGASGWDGPAVVGAARAVGSILLAGEPLIAGEPSGIASVGTGYAVSPLAGNGTLITAVAGDAPSLRARLNAGLNAGLNQTDSRRRTRSPSSVAV